MHVKHVMWKSPPPLPFPDHLNGCNAKGSLGQIWDHLKLLYIERLAASFLFFSFLFFSFLFFSFLFFSFLFFSFLFFSDVEAHVLVRCMRLYAHAED